MTLGTFCAQSHTALDSDTLKQVTETELTGANLKAPITPEMIDSIRKVTVIDNFDQEYESTVFVPKGQWIAGVSLSYEQTNQNNYEFLILQGISGDTYSFKVSPMLLYAIKDDMALGGKLSYNRGLTKLESADVVLDSETSYNVDALYSLSHNYYATFLMRNYFSLGNSKRFGIFTELQCQLGGGQSKLTQGRGEDISGTYERNFSANIGLVPGITMFLSNYSAIEVNVGVLGFNYTKTKSITDQIYVANRHSEYANFRINLFSITFGCTFYI